MMRFQRVIPDSVPLSNGKKPSTENGRPNSNGLNTASANFETKGFRFRSPSRNQDHHQSGSAASSPQHSDDNHNNQTQRQDNSSSPSPSNGGSGDRLLQWGQKKRARVSRSEIRALVDESSPSVKARQPLNKASRRVDGNKISSASMPPPPPPPPPLLQQSRGGNLIKKEGSALFPHRNLEKRSSAGNGSPSRNSGGSSKAVSRSTTRKRSPPTPDNNERKMPSSTRSTAKDEKPNGSTPQADHKNHLHSASANSGQEAGVSNYTAPPTEKVNNVAEVIEWPRIYIALSRREKEDDFFAMKGTKLPHRPKKRSKTVDKALQYCFPGMWLSDLTKSRYEVREKKSVKKPKRRGLKGMESVDSDSE